MGLGDVEQEVIILKAIDEIIDSVVNFEVLALVGDGPYSEVGSNSITHQRFFNIVLVDFLSCTDQKTLVDRKTYLDASRAICERPSFDFEGSIEALRDAINSFISWLYQEVCVDVWLPSINVKGAINISRLSFLKMCGNISKHNFLRLGRVAEELRNILASNGITIEPDDSMPALADFYDRFHTDVFNYHTSTIAESLNNIRWGIYRYLQPELLRSTVWEEGDTRGRQFKCPETVAHEFAQQCYWDLMNEVSREPYFKRFRVSELLKQRY